MSFFKIPKSYFIKVNYNIPDNVSGVYAFYSEEGFLLYVGKAKNLRSRLYQHIKSGSTTNNFNHLFHAIELIPIQKENDIDLCETFLIKEWNPIFNKQKINHGLGWINQCNALTEEEFRKHKKFR